MFISKNDIFKGIISSIFAILMLSVVPCLAANQSINAEDLIYVTEQYPPYNFVENGELQGISVDIIQKIWKSQGANLSISSIEFLPWTECYQRTLSQNKTVLLFMFRVPEREKLFKWAGPLAEGRDVIIVKGNNVTINDSLDLKKYRIGGLRDDIAVTRLLNEGVKSEDIVLENTSKPIIEMLVNGSIDAWAYNEYAGLWLIQNSGENISEFKVAYVLSDGQGYMAFNNMTPDSVVESFQEAIDDIKEEKDENGSSIYEMILAKYVPKPFAANLSRQQEARAFLDEAVDYVTKNGETKAILEFNKSNGPFVRGDLYIFAYDFNGTCLAHPINSSLVGKKGLVDSNGIDIVGREIMLAKRGGGSMYIVFANPANKGKEELKQLYIKPVNNSFYLGTGLYLSEVHASFDRNEINDLQSYVHEALDYAKENGKEKALAAFNDKEGNFTGNDRYVFAYDYDGHVLALPFQSELIGINRTSIQDPNGVYFIKQALYLAKNGNGSHYYIYPDPSKNMTQTLKLSYVTDVDGTWFLGSGIYA